MRTVIFTTANHPYANKIINHLLQMKSIKVICIVESSVLYPNKSRVGGLIKYLKVSGFEYVFFQMLKVFIIRIGKKIYGIYPKRRLDHFLADIKEPAKRQKIPIITESNINSLTFGRKMGAKRPDLFISVFFNQIFKDKLLSITKVATINIHPGLLPSYRGVSPTFWVLANGETVTGTTIHTITNSQIDRGLTLYQIKVKIRPDDTEHSLYIKCINSVLPDLEQVINKIKNKKEGIRLSKNTTSYYSLPTKEAIKRFKDQGRKFYNLGELFYEQ